MIAASKNNGSLGVKTDGRLYGTLPLTLLKKVGIDPKGHVTYSYLRPIKGQPKRLVFEGTSRKRGDCVIQLKHSERSHHARFEVQKSFKRFDRISSVSGWGKGLECEVRGDELHLILPHGLSERDEHVEQEEPALIESPPTPRSSGRAVQLERLKNRFGIASGLSDDANDFAQMLLEFVQDRNLMQRFADYVGGREREAEDGWFEAELEKFRKEIY